MCCHQPGDFPPTNDIGDGPTFEATSPNFTEDFIARDLPDGYSLIPFLFAAHTNERPDLVGFGLGEDQKPAAINFFQNPKHTNSLGWKRTVIQKLDWPVAAEYADLTENGYNDVVISDNWGPGMWDLWDAKTKDGGRISWLENPGNRNVTGHWKMHKIGNSTGMHRFKVGHFSQKKEIQVMGFPILLKSNDYTSPAPVVVFTAVYGADRSKGPARWVEETAYADNFRIIHDISVIRGAGQDLDKVVVAGREGISVLWYNSHCRKWEHHNVAKGIPNPPAPEAHYWGSGSVDFARVKDDPVGYIAAGEAMHGNEIVVYVKKDAEHHKGWESLKDSSLWTRHLLHKFTPLSEKFTGTIHFVATGDFDGSGVDSFVVACIGFPVGKAENQGVYLFKPTDISKGRFEKSKISNQSAGRCALGEYNTPGVLDSASISFYIPGFHVPREKASVRVDYNNRIVHKAV